MAPSNQRFAIALSFPGEHREFVREVADFLAEALGRDKIFFDEWHESYLIGANGDLKLRSVYRDCSELVVPFFSAHYAKPWCSLEWSAIREILLERRNDDCVKPIAFDETAIDGWGANDFAARVRERSSKEIANLILEAYRLRRAYKPAMVDRPSKSRKLSPEQSVYGLMEPNELDSQHALDSLISLDSAGEKKFLALLGVIELDLPAEYRCLQYVASRRRTLGPRLVSAACDPSSSARSNAARLCQALACRMECRERVFSSIHQHFVCVEGSVVMPADSFWQAYDDGSLVDALVAYGNLGGSSMRFLQWAGSSSYAWEKISVHAFRAACCSYAISGQGGSHLVKFIAGGIRKEPYPRPFPDLPSEVLWGAAYHGPFARWTRNDVVHELVGEWRRAGSKKARLFASRVVEGYGPSSIVPIVQDWISSEGDDEVRGSLSRFVFNEEMNARVGSFEAMAEKTAANNGEVLVWLARGGVRSAGLTALLSSSDWYSRCCGIVSKALLGDVDTESKARELLHGASESLEKLLLSVALAICSRERGAETLRCALERLCCGRYADDRIDLRCLQRVWRAIIGDLLDREFRSSSLWLKLMRPINLDLD